MMEDSEGGSPVNKGQNSGAKARVNYSHVLNGDLCSGPSTVSAKNPDLGLSGHP